MSSVVAVVEGDGDFRAFPLLLRRLLHEKHEHYDLDAGQPVNARGRSKLVNEFEKFIRHAERKPRCGAILVLIDADDDCPRQLAQELAARAKQAGVSKPTAVVCARREYETWFLASLGTIQGNSGIPATASFTGDAEDMRDPKGWLTRHMPQGRAYKETSDQASLTRLIDLEMACGNSRSFRRLCHAVEQLIESIGQGTAMISP